MGSVDQAALEHLLAGPPTPRAQAALLALFAAALEPLCRAQRLPVYSLRPSRAQTRYGQTRRATPLVIEVRCTRDGDPRAWRTAGSIVLTLLHELSHLRHRHHGPSFWHLHRRLVDDAFAAGVYDPARHDTTERGRGDEKLAGTAAHNLAEVARARRRQRALLAARELRAWHPGDFGRITAEAGARFAHHEVRVVRPGRTRLLVTLADGRHLRVSPEIVRPIPFPSRPFQSDLAPPPASAPRSARAG